MKMFLYFFSICKSLMNRTKIGQVSFKILYVMTYEFMTNNHKKVFRMFITYINILCRDIIDFIRI